MDAEHIVDSLRCKSCGVPYADHLGLVGTCKRVRELETLVESLRAFILSLGHKTTDAIETIMRKAEPPTPIEEIRRKAAELMGEFE